MRLVTLILILNFQFGHILATFPHSLGLPAQTNHSPKGYECGDVFFTYSEVNDVLILTLESLYEGYNYPQRYQGQLYSESKFKEYFIYPICKGTRILPQAKYIATTYRVVFTTDSKEPVDVIAKITTGDYTKCIRRDSSHIEPSHLEPVIPNGYVCGHEFFTDEILRQSLAIAQSKIGESTRYPCPYVGNLFPADGGYQMWPILRGKNLYKSGTVHIGPYYLILNKEWDLVEVVVKGFSNNFLRCIRSRQAPKAPASDPHSKLFVPPPKTGYICGKAFFDDKVLENSAEIAKTQVSKVNMSKFPKEYSGHPYNQQCLIWPLKQDGNLYKRGTIGPYRLVLNLDYKVLSVAILDGKVLKACDKKTIKSKKNHDTSEYLCAHQSFSHQNLVTAAEEACAKMNTGARYRYPAKYVGPEFDLKGPYFTYPVFQRGVYGQRHVGLDRVVINTNCEVVGALTTLNKVVDGDLKNGFQRRLVKCHRLDDGPLPDDFFGENAMP
ncbi:hypothetical protein EPUL_005081, partial [Erysiphe pulchra]